MKAFMYSISAVFAVFALVVLITGLSSVSLIGGIAFAVVFGSIGYVAEA